MDVVKLACERTVMQTGKASFAYADRILENWKRQACPLSRMCRRRMPAFAAKKAQNTSTAQTAEKPQRAQKQNRFINYTQSEWDFAELERLEREQREKMVKTDKIDWGEKIGN